MLNMETEMEMDDLILDLKYPISTRISTLSYLTAVSESSYTFLSRSSTPPSFPPPSFPQYSKKKTSLLKIIELLLKK
jgi:hypothetical protein